MTLTVTDFVLAFLVGGSICLVAQLVLNLTNLTPAHVMVLFVSLGAVLSGLGLYKPLVDIGGAGATVPLTGFGHALVQGIVQDLPKKGAVALLTGGFTGAAMGLAAAILSGFVFSVLFNPKG